MRLAPRSLSGRLLALSMVTTIVALLLAAIGIGQVLERFVMRGLDQQLDAEVAMLRRALRPDGTLDGARIVDLPAFADAEPGWGWYVESPRGRWSGGTPIGITPLPPALPGPHGPPPMGGMPGEGTSATGEPVHMRRVTIATAAGDATIVAAGPRRLAVAPLREAMTPLLASLALLGLVLVAATVVQLRLGLRPLRALRAALVEVRAGRLRHVPDGQLEELAPLARELNALIDQNEAQLAHARWHVANLAHGLKTPLAALALKLAAGGTDPDGSLRAMVADIDGRVRHHLGRARAATPAGRHHARTLLAPAVDDLTAVMRGVHADRAIGCAIDVAPDLAVAVDAQDLDEMIGNLLDNAWRFARSAVTITAVASGSMVMLAIEDDGAGLSKAAIDEAMMPGRRLDERGDGHGFGLPIAHELAELNGGTLQLEQATLGGLRAILLLPGAMAG